MSYEMQQIRQTNYNMGEELLWKSIERGSQTIILDLKLKSFGATLIVGPKGCGKTTTAKQKSQKRH